MTTDEYQDLIAYLGKHFGQIEQRLTRVEVYGEETRHLVQIVAEGVTTVDRKLEEFKTEVREEFRAVREEMRMGFGAVREEMRLGFGAVDRRFVRLERGQPR